MSDSLLGIEQPGNDDENKGGTSPSEEMVFVKPDGQEMRVDQNEYLAAKPD